ncbi:glycosyltransferase family 2 protein [Saliterribacillus persicus]|uniref:Glycosyltransferase involved in cell wall biosynthesis n=1 Tax=Saliterribacillus persicus TaxID=930114 RepID=A0A368YAZ4_9BACI|nr:glycosyltransferase family A protein [Saliterribacillus persicus]RCW77372.1 glycosyltransferase involved in cell wall biosynthesis [Saliterribacillus persicus]
MPRVTVIMAAYNAEGTIIRAIESIQNQTFSDWELIICDDCSSDLTVEIIKSKTLSDNRIKLVSNSVNMYAAFSRNKCIKQASGEYIVIQDSDDYSHHDRIQICVDYLDNTKDVDFVSTSAFFFDHKTIWGQRVLLNGIRKSDDLIKGLCFVHAATTFRKRSIDVVEGYRVDKETRRGQDYDLFMRMYASGLSGATLSNKLYYIYETNNGYKRRKYKYRIDEAKLRYKGYKAMNTGFVNYIYILKPLVLGLVPNKVMFWIKRIIQM